MYNDLYTLGKKFINDLPCYGLCSNGWANVKNQHLVNYIVCTPNIQPFYYKSINSSSIQQAGDAILEGILSIINKLGPELCISIVTYNCASMQRCWEILESKNKNLFGNGCGAHTLNLLVGDIIKLHNFQEIIQKSKVINFIKNHYFVFNEFEKL